MWNYSLESAEDDGVDELSLIKVVILAENLQHTAINLKRVSATWYPYF